MQINRLMDIIFILLGRGTVTAGEFANQFGVSERTIYRDVDTLTLSGIPIVMTKGRNGGIRLLDGYKLDKAILTDKDKQEILSSLHIFGSVAPEGSTAISKLKGIFGNIKADIFEIDFDSWSNEAGQKELFAQLKQSIINQRQVHFKYHATSGNSERVVCPLKLCFKSQAWYLYAFCLFKNDYRFFKLSRIRNLKQLSQTFHMTAKENVLKDGAGYNDTLIDLTLQIAREKAYRVYDEFEDITILENGDFLVKCKFPIGEWLYQWIASYLGNCIVIEPYEIKEKMQEFYRIAFEKNAK